MGIRTNNDDVDVSCLTARAVLRSGYIANEMRNIDVGFAGHVMCTRRNGGIYLVLVRVVPGERRTVHGPRVRRHAVLVDFVHAPERNGRRLRYVYGVVVALGAVQRFHRYVRTV